jgi:hypothetical protein
VLDALILHNAANGVKVPQADENEVKSLISTEVKVLLNVLRSLAFRLD